MNEEIQRQVKEIKQSFRQMMDGSVAQSMRDKGLNYHLNWGATLPRLREKAEEIKQSALSSQHTPLSIDSSPLSIDPSPQTSDISPLYSLSIALWKENVRECKILATMIMPSDEVSPEVVDIWMEQTETLEIAEQAAFNLYQYLPFAPEKAFQWLASAEDLPQICGYHILSRLFSRKMEPNERSINEFIDQALVALQSTNPSLRKAAYQSLVRFSDLGLMYQRLAQSALKSIGLA